MTAPTFPNAAPPPGALFDNAPTVATAKPPAQPTPATRIAQVRGGKWVAVDVLMQYGAPIPLPLALALARVRNGRTVFVAREDAAAVMEAVQGVTGGETA